MLSMLAIVAATGVEEAGQAEKGPHNSMKKSVTARHGDYKLAHGKVMLCIRTGWQQPCYQAVARHSRLALHLFIQMRPVKARIELTAVLTSIRHAGETACTAGVSSRTARILK